MFIGACNETYTPKPRGYYRINLPKKNYHLFDSLFPYKFEYPDYCKIEIDTLPQAQPYWINLHFGAMKGTLHISYKKLKENFGQCTEDARTLVYKHTVKADDIQEKRIEYPDKQVFGIGYEISGNAASSYQFFLSDSSKNFLRGALYFNSTPNIDSIEPVLKFVKEDIDHFIKTFEWKDI